MINLKSKGLACIIVAALSMSSCSAPKGLTGAESYKTTGEKLEDRKIVNRIKDNFRKNTSIPQDLVHLSIDRGIVQLSGFVKSVQEADLIILSTAHTEGVKDVIDNLIVLSGSEYAKRRANAETRDAKRW